VIKYSQVDLIKVFSLFFDKPMIQMADHITIDPGASALVVMKAKYKFTFGIKKRLIRENNKMFHCGCSGRGNQSFWHAVDGGRAE
jgi:hypothetical protein